MGLLRPRAVTIGIATWNRQPLLQKAIESVQAQTYEDIEIVVSNDGSTDNTREYLSSLTDPRIKVIDKPVNQGLVPNYNSCLYASTCEFFLMLNDDDSLLPTAIEKLLRAVQSPPEGIEPEQIGVSWCPYRLVNSDGTELWDARGGPALETTVSLIEGLFLGTRGPICSGIMVRTEDAFAVGGYEQQFEALCDGTLWGKAALRRPYGVCVNEPLMKYLVHGASGSATSDAQCIRWQNAIAQQVTDFTDILREHGDALGARRLARAGNASMANITASVLMRSLGKRGWLRKVLHEVWRSRRFMLTPFVVKRTILDGWKLVRMNRMRNAL